MPKSHSCALLQGTRSPSCKKSCHRGACLTEMTWFLCVPASSPCIPPVSQCQSKLRFMNGQEMWQELRNTSVDFQEPTLGPCCHNLHGNSEPCELM